MGGCREMAKRHKNGILFSPRHPSSPPVPVNFSPQYTIPEPPYKLIDFPAGGRQSTGNSPKVVSRDGKGGREARQGESSVDECFQVDLVQTIGNRFSLSLFLLLLSNKINIEIPQWFYIPSFSTGHSLVKD